MKHFLCALGLVLTGLIATPAWAATFWDDEMETGNTGYSALYDWGACGGVLAFTNDTVIKYSGAGSLKETFVQPRQTCEGFGDRTFTQTTDLWIRLYIRLSPDWQTDPIGTKLVRQDATDSTYSDWWVMLWGGTDVTVSLQNYPLGETINLYPNVGNGSLSPGQWTCLEMHTRRNTPGQSNGIVEAWKNGTQFTSHTGLSQFANLSFNSLRMVRQDGTGSINYDRIATGNTRIGCIGAPPPSDTIPPNPPTNLQVQ